jgi:hypothetical protein
MTRVGQRCALPWYRLGPIQKFGPPDGIVTRKFGLVIRHRRKVFELLYLIGFLGPMFHHKYSAKRDIYSAKRDIT